MVEEGINLRERTPRGDQLYIPRDVLTELIDPPSEYLVGDHCPHPKHEIGVGDQL